MQARYARYFPIEHRAAPDRARKEIRDGLVFDFVRNQRRAVENAQNRNDEADVEEPHHHPEQPGPPTRAPLSEKRQNGVVAVTIRIAAASSTGPPSNNPRNTERRDQSIWPSDRSNTRADDASMDSAAGRAPSRSRPTATATDADDWRTDDRRLDWTHVLHQILEHGLEIVVRRRDFVNRSELAAGGELREARVEHIRLRRLHDDGIVFELEAEHVVGREKFPGQRARLIRPDEHRVRMLVDEVANLVDVALGEDPALIDEQDVGCHRLDLVKDMARDDDALARPRPLLDETDRLAARDRVQARERFVEDEQTRDRAPAPAPSSRADACPCCRRRSSCRRRRAGRPPRAPGARARRLPARPHRSAERARSPTRRPVIRS